VLVGACLCVPPAASGAAPKLKVTGNHLVDARSGLVFVPRGVDWPSFEYACENGYGYSNTRAPGTRHVGPDAAGAAAIARWHINTVRLPLNQDCWLGEDGLPAFGKRAGYRRAVRRWVARLHAAGIVVVLDLHWSGPTGVPADGQRAMADDHSDDFWRSVARTFKRDRSVIFDVFNEPFSVPNRFDLSWTCWRDGGCQAPVVDAPGSATFTTLGMQALVDAVRSTGARQPIVLTGRGFGNDLAEWADHEPVGDGLVAGFHNYDISPCKVQSCWDSTIAPLAAQVPVLTAEMAASDCKATHVKAFMDWADDRDVGYLIWAWWLLPGRSCTSLAVIRDVKGTPRKPNGTALKAHLAKLVPRATLEVDRTQALDGAVELAVRCRARCWVEPSGRVRLGGRTSRMTGRARLLAGRRTGAFELTVPRAARRTEQASARVEVLVSNGSHTTLRRATVKLAR
jgi:endoglucanase